MRNKIRIKVEGPIMSNFTTPDVAPNPGLDKGNGTQKGGAVS